MSRHLNIKSLLPLALTLMGFGAMCGGLLSCSDELDVPAPPVSEFIGEPGYLTLSLKCGALDTRAAEEGVDALNENRIESVTLCLSPAAGDRTDDLPPVFMQTFRGLDAEGEAVIRVPLTTELLTRLFQENSDAECRIFAAVNVEPGDAATITDLRSLVIGSEFHKKDVQKAFAMDGDGTVKYSPAGNYAVGSVDVRRSAAKITLALDVDSEVQETVDGQALTWTHDPEGIRVVLNNGVHTSTLDPAPVPSEMTDDLYFDTPDTLTYPFREQKREGAYAAYDRVQQTPFYTYPNKWTDSLFERHGTFMMLSVPWTSDGGRTWRTCYYHVPVVPTNRFELVRNVSYHVNLHVGVLGSFVPEEPLEIEGDYYVADWGKEDIEVDIKDYRYLVVDQNVFNINNEDATAIPFYTSHETVVTEVTMRFYRYNFSDQGSEFAVTVSSDQNELSKSRGGEHVYECSFDNRDNMLNLSHTLDVWVPYNSSGAEVSLIKGLDSGEIANVRDASGRYYIDNQAALDKVLQSIAYFKRSKGESEYSRVVYDITVQHKDVADGSAGIDKSLYKETVTVNQFPGMYITAYQNYSDMLADDSKPTASGVWGNTIINGRTDNWTTGYNYANTIDNAYFNWSQSLGLSRSFLNWNPNLYLITITQLSPEDGRTYKIGDPRSDFINNNLSNASVDAGRDQTDVWNNGNKTYRNKTIEMGFTEAPALNESGKRRLKYYYPTIEGESTYNMIAPKLRICSSYGGTSAYLTREMSRRRAAAYQEMGYLAGRWRLPTFGEVNYIIGLSTQNKIPRLFGRDNGIWFYWCAHGAVKVPKRGDTTTKVEIVANPSGGGNDNFPDIFYGDNYKDHARFVYDEWYWGDMSESAAKPNGNSLIYPFTWGDRQKTNPQPNPTY